MLRRFAIPVILMSCLLGLTACGDDDDSATASEAESGSGDSGAEDSGSGSADSGAGSGDSSAEYCAFARDASAAFNSLGADSTPEDFEAAYGDVADAIDGVEGNVPAEIAEAFDLNAERFDAAHAAFEAADFDPSAVDEEALAAFETDEYSAATDAVDAYDTEVCGIES